MVEQISPAKLKSGYEDAQDNILQFEEKKGPSDDEKEDDIGNLNAGNLVAGTTGKVTQ